MIFRHPSRINLLDNEYDYRVITFTLIITLDFNFIHLNLFFTVAWHEISFSCCEVRDGIWENIGNENS